MLVLKGSNTSSVFEHPFYKITLPDIKGRAKILNVHLDGIKTEGNTTELSKHLAALTHGFTGAEIANVVNEAALIAARFAAKNVTLDHIKSAMERVVAGIAFMS